MEACFSYRNRNGFAWISCLYDQRRQHDALNRAYAHVAVDNLESLALFQHCGFEQCGILKAWWRVEGEYKDVALLQLLN